MVEFSQAIGKIILTEGAKKRVMSAEPKMVEALEKMAETAKMNGAEVVDVDGAKLAKALNAKYVPWKSAGGMAYVPKELDPALSKVKAIREHRADMRSPEDVQKALEQRRRVRAALPKEFEPTPRRVADIPEYTYLESKFPEEPIEELIESLRGFKPMGTP